MHRACLALPATTAGLGGRACPGLPSKLVLVWLPTPGGEARSPLHPCDIFVTRLCDLLLLPSFPSVVSPRSVTQALNTSWGKQTLVSLQAALGTLNTTKGLRLRGWHTKGLGLAVTATRPGHRGIALDADRQPCTVGQGKWTLVES